MHEDVTLPADEVTLPERSLWWRLPILAGVTGLSLLVLSTFFGDHHRLAFSYLAAYMYWVTIALGGLFFVIVHFVARAGWSVVVRRLAENVMATLPIFVLLFIPIWLWRGELYHWLHPEGDPLLEHKRAYLNEWFFFIRSIVYLAVWSFLANYFRRLSARQDVDGDPEITRRLQTRSAPAAVLFAITFVFASFDWLMSLEPHWFSTIFGVYVFAGSVIGIFAVLILLTAILQRGGQLRGLITEEHYHDMGKMLFAFVVFWAYIGFSQFMLIWYANIPEETFWYDMRWHGGWKTLSIFLAAGHFGLPFFYLLPQPIKRNPITLGIAAVWLLFMHYVDMFWLVMPTLHGDLHFSWLDVTCFLGVGTLFLAALAWHMTRGSLVPLKDPRLSESLAFHSM